MPETNHPRSVDAPFLEELNSARKYLDAIGSMFIAIDEQGRIALINEYACHVLGWTEQDAQGRNWFENFLPEEVRDDAKKFFDQLMTGEVEPVKLHESIVLTKSGEEIMVRWRSTVLNGPDGRILGTLSSGEDITKQKQYEEKLKEDEQRFRDLFEGNKSVELIIDPENGRIIRANRAAEVFYGYSNAQLLAMNISDINVLSSEEVHAEMALAAVEKRDHFLFRHRLADGEVRDVEVHSGPILSNGKKLLYSIIHDISKQKEAEHKIKALSSLQQSIIETAPIGVFWKDCELRYLGCNTAHAQHAGLGHPDEIVGKTDFDLPWKDIADGYRTDDLQVLQTGRPKIGYEERMITPDGRTIWVRTSKVALRDDSGAIIGVLGIYDDITERKKAEDDLKASKAALESSATELRASLIGTVMVISKAVESRDPYTAGHQQRVARLARSIAQAMKLDKDMIEGIRMGATIHDIGKLHLPAEILSKPSRLSDVEYRLVQDHTLEGYGILKGIEFPWPVANIALQHHERLDGSGYPQGLKGNQICLEARIVAVADVVEAISSHRPYRPAMGLDSALDEIKKHRGEYYDPEVVDICLKLFEEKQFSFEDL